MLNAPECKKVKTPKYPSNSYQKYEKKLPRYLQIEDSDNNN